MCRAVYRHLRRPGRKRSDACAAIEYDKFQMFLKGLEEQYESYRQTDDSLPKLTEGAIAGLVIQHFETCFDCLWKVLKRYLIEELALADAPNSPRSIFRLACENDLLDRSPEGWFDYTDARIGTAHDYSGEKAQACLEIMGDFIEDAIGLYQTMTEETWD
ncbi:MAG: nucleotidyltransferase substrate binding protein [Acidobacteriota bacterium]|nr:nucleotidyltransferase substrate binding protein [Acidobacteriota bacterium]